MQRTKIKHSKFTLIVGPVLSRICVCTVNHILRGRLKAYSHGAMCDSVFLSHVMGCVDVNDTVHVVQLQCIFVCDVRYHILMDCIPILCDCDCDSKKCNHTSHRVNGSLHWVPF